MSRLFSLSSADAIMSVMVNSSDIVSIADLVAEVSDELRHRYERLLDRWTSGRKLVHFLEGTGIGHDVQKAMHAAFSSSWFSGYDWVVKMDPDVVIYNENYLMVLMGRPETWGVFASCNKGKQSCRQSSGCGLGEGFMTNADFFCRSS